MKTRDDILADLDSLNPGESLSFPADDFRHLSPRAPGEPVVPLRSALNDISRETECVYGAIKALDVIVFKRPYDAID